MAPVYKIALCSFFVVFFSVVIAEEEKRFLLKWTYAKKFLKQYHYLSPLKSGNHDWKTALKLYQEFMHLPVTGKLDDETFKEMEKPRCGFPDLEEDEETGISKRYGVSAQPWSTTSLTYGFVNYCDDLTRSTCESIIAKSFKLWSDNTVLTFTKISDATKADIKIAFVRKLHNGCNFPFDGKNGVLAHAMYPIDGSIHFDDDETFTSSIPGSNEYDLFSVAAHEIGHAIGVAHTDVKSAIMHAEYKYTANSQLHADDKNAIAYLYGGGTIKPQITQPPNCADIYGGCQSYQYLCNFGQMGSRMKKLCPNTCGHCSSYSGQISSQCKDNYDTNWCKGILGLFPSACSDPDVLSKCKKTCNNC